jgi:hypothetical protein
MARTIKITYKGKTYEPSIQALNRDKLYGFIENMIEDDKGQSCFEGSLLEDGQTLIGKGCSAIKLLDEKGLEVDKKELKAVDANGKPLNEVLSIFETGISLKEGGMDDLFDLEVDSVYDFNWSDENMKAAFLNEIKGKVFTFEFNYRTDYEGADAVLISNSEGAFILSGRKLEFEFLSNKNQTIIAIPELEEENEEDQGMDFSMF